MPLIDVIKLSETLCKAPIKAELKYATRENFVGRPINGYEPDLTDFALMTPKAAEQLCHVQNHLNQQYGCGLIIYDSYRPKRAVQDFLQWIKQKPVSEYELERKAKHYPRIEKSQLFELGYLVEDSGHCYGNTVDNFLVDINTGEILDMGARYDYMDKLSCISTSSQEIGELAYKNRMTLVEAMQKFGFHAYEEEFWHFSHGGKEGREVSQPIDIEITGKLKGIIAAKSV